VQCLGGFITIYSYLIHLSRYRKYKANHEYTLRIEGIERGSTHSHILTLKRGREKWKGAQHIIYIAYQINKSLKLIPEK